MAAARRASWAGEKNDEMEQGTVEAEEPEEKGDEPLLGWRGRGEGATVSLLT